MKFLPRGISKFRTVIEDNYVYVDKTKEIYQLFSTGDRYLFLARPRRFGKSLLLSTMKELFEGNRDLFKGLWIDQEESYAWQKYPVIHMDMTYVSDIIHPELFEESLSKYLMRLAQSFDITLAPDTARNLFINFVEQLYKQKGPVIVLIDEYDKPLLDQIDSSEKVIEMRNHLQSFYGALKPLSDCLRFIFITGVSKFSKTSIFSGLNNIVDLSLDPIAATLLGYTREEIFRYFPEQLTSFAAAKKVTLSDIADQMTEWYNGYRFSYETKYVYNPFSVLYYLKNYRVGNYWFESGTPTFLLKFIREQYAYLADIRNFKLSHESISNLEVGQVHVETILFQTGYLTIASHDPSDNSYVLGYPNREVRDSLYQLIVAALANTSYTSVSSAAYVLVAALNKDDLPKFFAALQALFAHITFYQRIKEEAFYHALFQFLGLLLGIHLQSEVLTDKGRIDLVISTSSHIYLFEIKHNKTTQEALQQIEDKKYYERYALDSRKIVLVGVSCNDQQGAVEIEWQEHRL